MKKMVKMNGSKKIYVVCKGRHKGIYDEWWECRSQVDGYKGAIYRGFTDPDEAIAYCRDEMPDDYYGNEEHLISIGEENCRIPDFYQFLEVSEAMLTAMSDGVGRILC